MFSTKKFFGKTTNALFRVGDISAANFFVRVDDQNLISRIRSMLEGQTDQLHILGTIVKEQVCWNPGWSYHYEPSSVNLFENAIEVCDATFKYVQDHLDEAGGAFLPGNQHCGWSNFLIEEVENNCPIETLEAQCCELDNSYSEISNTRTLKIEWKPDQTQLSWMQIEVNYSAGPGPSGWFGYSGKPRSSDTKINASLFMGSGYQRYRVRYQNSEFNPTSFGPWSYTNPVKQFTTGPTTNPICP